MNKLMMIIGTAALLFVPLAASADVVTYDLSRPYAQYLTATETTIWEHRNLADIESFTCIVKGGWIPTPKPGIGVIYDRTPTSFSVQFQCKDGYCKAVRAYFRQDGANIVARADKAAYVDESFYGTRIEDSNFWRELATSDSSGTYGAKGIEAFGDVAQTINAFPDEADAIVVSNGILQVNVASDKTISTPISGNGGLRFHGSGVVAETQHTFDQYVTTANQTLIENTDIFDIEITSAVFNGRWCGRSEGARPYNVTSNLVNKTMRVQLQKRFGTWNNLYGFIVELSQSGDDVLVKGISTRQGGDGKTEGSDMSGWTGSTASIATSAAADGYGLESISFTRRSLPMVILNGENNKAWTGGTDADGCKVKVTKSRLALNTTARAMNGGVLELAVGGAWDSLPHNTFVAEAGSTIYFMAGWTINQNDTLKALGGAVKFDGAENIYVNDALFTDGATWSGVRPQVAYQRDAYWRTEGESEIEIFANFRLVASSATRKVTLDTEANTVFHGLLEENGNYPGATFIKKGSAKVTFEEGSEITGPLQLEGGTISFGGDASFGALVVAGESAVEIGAGKTLSFAASNDKEWSSNVRLNITGAFNSSDQVVRVGTDSTGLTKAQLSKVRINDMRCKIDESGWLHPYVSGFIMFVK